MTITMMMMEAYIHSNACTRKDITSLRNIDDNADDEQYVIVIGWKNQKRHI